MSDESMKEFGKNIRSRRTAKGWDQYELARRVGTTATTVGRWENAKTIPRPHHVTALKRELGFTDNDFLTAFGVRPLLPTKNSDRYTACSMATAKKRLGSFESLAAACTQISDEWPVPVEPGEYGAHEKWCELRQLSPESGGVVSHHDEIIGFWECLAVHDDIYEAILRGENVNKIIEPGLFTEIGRIGCVRLKSL